MALNPKIIHFQIITKDQLPLLPTDQQRMILCSDTGQVFWEYRRQRHSVGSIPVQSDWDQTDSTKLAYIKNKPDIKSIESRLEKLQKAQQNVQSLFILVTNDMISINDSSEIFINTSDTRIPICVVTPQSVVYPIQKNTLFISQDNTVRIRMNSYLVYQNSIATPIGWKVYYG